MCRLHDQIGALNASSCHEAVWKIVCAPTCLATAWHRWFVGLLSHCVKSFKRLVGQMPVLSGDGHPTVLQEAL
eukprot:9980649-Karenia_brevis.AAC.1